MPSVNCTRAIEAVAASKGPLPTTDVLLGAPARRTRTAAARCPPTLPARSLLAGIAEEGHLVRLALPTSTSL